MAGLEARERGATTERKFVFATDAQLELVSKTLDAWRPGLGLALQLMQARRQGFLRVMARRCPRENGWPS
jgi:hypothetical protein